MGQISEARLDVVRGLIAQAPDAAVRNLLRALSADGGHDEGLTSIQHLVEAEAADRRARNMTFAPIAPLCCIPGPFTRLSFPPRTLALIWKAAKAETPDQVAEAKALAANWRPENSPAVFDAICTRTAERLRTGGGAFEPVVESANAGGGAEALAGCLDIAEVTRRALNQMPEWLGRMTSEKAAKVRLAYRDAVAVAEDAGPRLFEMLAAHLSEPWLILRVISGVMDKPAEGYLSASEHASFPERVLDDIDRRLAELSAFKAQAGRDAAMTAAQCVQIATTEVSEVEQSIALTPEGIWGKRLARQRKALAATIEAHLRAVDAAVGQALPLQTVRMGPRSRRGVPKLVQDPDPALKETASALLIFVAEVRASAAVGGFASARAKALEVVDARLESYVEDLLEEIRGGESPDLPRARAYLEVAAELCGLARDEKAAQIVRRRAAAA
jgi:hypothetical protein